MSIELELLEYLKAWLQEFYNLPDDDERIVLPHIPYSFPAIQRELLRRDRIEGIMEDFGK